MDKIEKSYAKEGQSTVNQYAPSYNPAGPNQKLVLLADKDYQYCRDKLYIELNPVRAGMVRGPRQYKRPSYRA